MTAKQRPQALDRYTTIGELSAKVRVAVRRLVVPLAALLAAEVAYLGYTGRPGAAAMAFVGIGTILALFAWGRRAIGLPLLPIIVVQNLVIYGVPVAAGHDVITAYPPDFVFGAGTEVLIFDAAMALAWLLGMQLFRPSPPAS